MASIEPLISTARTISTPFVADYRGNELPNVVEPLLYTNTAESSFAILDTIADRAVDAWPIDAAYLLWNGVNCFFGLFYTSVPTTNMWESLVGSKVARDGQI